MELDGIKTIIATRELILSGKSNITIIIGKPEKFPDGDDYYCPYQIKGLGNEKINYAGGIDTVQSLLLALQKIGAVLYTSDEAKSGILKWTAGASSRDLGFPVPNVLKDLLPN